VSLCLCRQLQRQQRLELRFRCLDGRLKSLEGRRGTNPQSVTVDPSGKYVYVANNAGSTVSQYTIGTNGRSGHAVPAVASGCSLLRHVDPSQYLRGERRRQQSLAVHDSTDGSLTPMSTLPSRRERIHSLSPSTLRQVCLCANDAEPYRSTPWYGRFAYPHVTVLSRRNEPRSVSVDPTGKYVYVANNGGGVRSTYRHGWFAHAHVFRYGPGGNRSQSVAVDPSGRYAYVANITAATSRNTRSDGWIAHAHRASRRDRVLIRFRRPFRSLCLCGKPRQQQLSQYTIGANGTLTANAPSSVPGRAPHSRSQWQKHGCALLVPLTPTRRTKGQQRLAVQHRSGRFASLMSSAAVATGSSPRSLPSILQASSPT